MVRLGFFLGFLIGGAVASLLARSKDEPALVTDRPATGDSAHPFVDSVRQHLSAAQDAAREAQLEKEAEMNRLFDSMVHRDPKAPTQDA